MHEVNSDDVVSILDYFKDLEDPRCTINRIHLLGDLIVICILAVISGADGPKAIGVWAQANAQWLLGHLQLPGGIPSHDTIGRLLAALKPAAFQNCFGEWIANLRGKDGADGDGDQEIIAMDGKALRRSHNKRRGLGPLFLVSAWAVRRGISLGQLATAEKSNEITAIPELIEQIDVTGAIVTIDAAGCQKEIAAKIIKGKGDYVLALKGNQGKLHQAVEEYLGTHMENDFADVAVHKYEEVVKGHGRLDTLLYYQLSAPASLPGRKAWKGLRTIGMAIRISQQNGKETSEVRYYISSLRLGVRRFAASVRGHWSIENTLHWCLDVTFREDDSRLRDRHAADNVAWLRAQPVFLGLV
jgi:predicted transposase YbfD/YdcC